MPHPIRRRVLHRDNSQLARIELEVALQVLPDQDGAASRTQKLIGAATVAFNHNRTHRHRVAGIPESAVQERLARRRKLFL